MNTMDGPHAILFACLFIYTYIYTLLHPCCTSFLGGGMAERCEHPFSLHPFPLIYILYQDTLSQRVSADGKKAAGAAAHNKLRRKNNALSQQSC